MATPTPTRRRRRAPGTVAVATAAAEAHEVATGSAETTITAGAPTSKPRVVATATTAPVELLPPADDEQGQGGDDGGCCAALARNQKCLMLVCVLAAFLGLGAMVFCYVMTWGLPAPRGQTRMRILSAR